MGVKIRGLDKIEANFKKYKVDAFRQIKDAVEDASFDLQGKSQRQAPVDSGDLRGSASTDIDVKLAKVTGEVGYNEEYALDQHEHLEYNHPRGGNAKYLEGPLKQNQSRYIKEISAALRRATQ